MRRTDQEFKAEVLRRSSAYQARRKKQIKQVLTSLSCAAVILIAAGFFWPQAISGSSTEAADAAAPENMMIDQNVSEEKPAEAPAAEEPESAAEDSQGSIKVRGVSDEAFTELTGEDAALLLKSLEGDWADAAANCLMDCILTVDGEEYHYHSACGTFTDQSALHSLKLSEETRQAVNAILEAYISLENYS